MASRRWAQGSVYWMSGSLYNDRLVTALYANFEYPLSWAVRRAGDEHCSAFLNAAMRFWSDLVLQKSSTSKRWRCVASLRATSFATPIKRRGGGRGGALEPQ